jgi:hypothetical protein
MAPPACFLTPSMLDRALVGELSQAEAEQLGRHLASDCPQCEAVLDRAGIAANDLATLLAGPLDNEALKPGVDRVWAALQYELPRPAKNAHKAARPFWPRLHLGFSLTALALTSSALVLMIFWPKNGLIDRSDSHFATKGATPLMQLELAITYGDTSSAAALADGDQIGFRYDLGAAAYLTLVHLHGGAKPAVIFASDGMAQSGQGLPLKAAGGQLAYRFEGESGEHLFALFASTQPLPENAALALADLIGQSAGPQQTAPVASASLARSGKNSDAFALEPKNAAALHGLAGFHMVRLTVKPKGAH